jgi:alkylresorcinol/alkylpyrone synthase
VLHPGGSKVLQAYEQALDVPSARLRSAWEILREHGNMSSPTVLFVLQRFLQTTEPVGALGLAIGLGPGFCAEGVVFRW